MNNAARTDNRVRIYWTIQLAGWAIFCAIIVFLFVAMRFSLIIFLLFWGINFVVCLAVTHFYRTRYGIKFNYRLGYIPELISSSILVLIAGVLVSGVINLLLIELTHGMSFQHDFVDYLKLFGVFIVIYSLWFLLFHSFQYGYVATQSYQEYLMAEAFRQTAENEVLKQQLNPHLLFNALNSIKSLTRTNPDRAYDALNHLSDLLRSSLKMSDSQLVPLSQELKFMEDYLSLEKIRFEERLQYSVGVTPEAKAKLIPPLILQTLAENAIKHGISQNKSGGIIALKIFMNDHNLILEMTNTSGQQSENTLGIGLQNLEKRLQLHFGRSAVFKLSNTHEHTTAHICIDTSQTRLFEK